MTARPTAAAATWPYAHPTLEEMEIVEGLLSQRAPATAEIVRASAIYDAFVALNKVHPAHSPSVQCEGRRSPPRAAVTNSGPVL